MISLLRSKRKITKVERVLWIIIGLMSFLPLSAVLLDNPSELFTDFRMIFFVFFYGMAALGLLFNWGPIVPCSIFGIVVSMIFTDPVSSSHMEAVIKVYVVPTIGSIIGAIFGFLIDWNLNYLSTIELDPDDIQDDESQ